MRSSSLLKAGPTEVRLGCSGSCPRQIWTSPRSEILQEPVPVVLWLHHHLVFFFLVSDWCFSFHNLNPLHFSRLKKLAVSASHNACAPALSILIVLCWTCSKYVSPVNPSRTGEPQTRHSTPDSVSWQNRSDDTRGSVGCACTNASVPVVSFLPEHSADPGSAACLRCPSVLFLPRCFLAGC